jgi:hypothetical protein
LHLDGPDRKKAVPAAKKHLPDNRKRERLLHQLTDSPVTDRGRYKPHSREGVPNRRCEKVVGGSNDLERGEIDAPACVDDK